MQRVETPLKRTASQPFRKNLTCIQKRIPIFKPIQHVGYDSLTRIVIVTIVAISCSSEPYFEDMVAHPDSPDNFKNPAYQKKKQRRVCTPIENSFIGRKDGRHADWKGVGMSADDKINHEGGKATGDGNTLASERDECDLSAL